MRRREQARTLRNIAAVRDVQQIAAEMAAGRAALAARRLDDARRDRLEALAEDQRGWADAMSRPRAGFEMARLWTAAVAESESDLRRLDVRIVDADRERAHASDSLRAAIGRAEVAEDMAARAARTVRRRDEEARLEALTDRLGSKRSA